MRFLPLPPSLQLAQVARTWRRVRDGRRSRDASRRIFRRPRPSVEHADLPQGPRALRPVARASSTTRTRRGSGGRAAARPPCSARLELDPPRASALKAAEHEGACSRARARARRAAHRRRVGASRSRTWRASRTASRALVFSAAQGARRARALSLRPHSSRRRNIQVGDDAARAPLLAARLELNLEELRVSGAPRVGRARASAPRARDGALRRRLSHCGGVASGSSRPRDAHPPRLAELDFVGRDARARRAPRPSRACCPPNARARLVCAPAADKRLHCARSPSTRSACARERRGSARVGDTSRAPSRGGSRRPLSALLSGALGRLLVGPALASSRRCAAARSISPIALHASLPSGRAGDAQRPCRGRARCSRST